MVTKSMLWLFATMSMFSSGYTSPELQLARLADECVPPDYKLNSSAFAFPWSRQPSVTQDGEGGEGGADGILYELHVRHASWFTVVYHENFKVVRNTLRGEVYILNQCGISVDSNASEPGYRAKAFEVPLRYVSLPFSTAANFAKLLEVDKRVKFAGPYVTSPCLQRLVAAGCDRVALDPTVDNGDDVAATALEEQFMQVDAVLDWTAMESEKSVAFTPRAEASPLARAEWIKFLAPFFNKEYEAARVFSDVEERYSALQSNVRRIQGLSGAPLPVVAWMRYNPGTEPLQAWIYFTLYKTRLTQDAGGMPLEMQPLLDEYPDVATRSGDEIDTWVQIDLSGAAGRNALLQTLQKVDILIDETSWDNYKSTFGMANATGIQVNHFMQLLNISSKEQFGFLRSGMIYRVDGTMSGTGGMDWWETGISRPDLVLEDLVGAVTPDVLNGTEGPWWIRKLGEHAPVIVTAADCKEWPTSTNQCAPPQPQPICPFVFRDCNGDIQFAHHSSEDRCKLPGTCPKWEAAASSVGTAGHSSDSGQFLDRSHDQSSGGGALSTAAVVGIALSCAVASSVLTALAFVVLKGRRIHQWEQFKDPHATTTAAQV